MAINLFFHYVLATMKRRAEGTSAAVMAAKISREDSSSDEDSHLTRQGRNIHLILLPLGK